ncbi:RNA polymerase sigma factor [Streptomyces alboflavus]|uniref:RNA polymerase sigma factor n=1 Tax=Streptomyces alboflavus TaxID=67267 RepID=UPI003688BD9D
MDQLPPDSLPQWGYIETNERAFRRHVLSSVGEIHEGDVSDKTFQSLHTRLQKGPVEKKIKDYAWKSFRNAVRTFHGALARQRARELLVGDDTWLLETSPVPDTDCAVEFGPDSVATTVINQMEMAQFGRVLDRELAPGELIAFCLVEFDGITVAQAAELLKIAPSTVRNAIHRARKKLKPMRAHLGLAK